MDVQERRLNFLLRAQMFSQKYNPQFVDNKRHFRGFLFFFYLFFATTLWVVTQIWMYS
jgi:hypothetical protein